MIFEDDETLRMYVEESLDHLADIEKELLAIEAAGADIDEDLVNSVFRAAHSIKGGAGFVGLTNIKELAHKIESILGMIRNREMIPRPEIISILLDGFDKLRGLINNIEKSDEMDIAEQIVSLVGLATASLPAEEKDSVSNMVNVSLPDGTVIFQISQFDIDQAHKTGKNIYLVEYDLIHDIQKKNRTPLEVINVLLNSGVIIQSKIDIEAVGTIDSEIPARMPFYVLFASIIEPDLIPNLFDVEKEYVHTITDELCSPAPSDHLKKQDIPPHFPDALPDNDIIEKDSDTVEPDSLTLTTPEIHELSDRVSESDDDTDNGFDILTPLKPQKQETEDDILNNQQAQSHTSLRVNVSLLDLLMTLAGELVLSRNQLVQGISTNNKRALETSAQRIDMVTSELQEAIMRTRMQSIANVFNKFPRVVRDLSKNIGKEIDLTIEGKNVELDKTIIEAISDPLTHLVRNAVDHGIEPPHVRTSIGKNPRGKVKLRAFHEAGQVNIEISDDGAGLDGNKLTAAAVKKGLITDQRVSLMSEKEKVGIIFLPGFSTAQKVTDMSGRGVGMDVVKTNLDKLGGIIDIESKVGEGTIFRIKLPLTLAIIPSQIISAGGERYAIPQVNLNELLRIPASQVKDRIERVGNAEVVRLRGTLLPLLNLCDVLGVKRLFISPNDDNEYPDKRKSIVDRRSTQSFLPSTAIPENEINDSDSDMDDRDSYTEQRKGLDRRYHSTSAINIAVVSAGTFKYGLVVDHLWDSEEIVVKPLGRHLKKCSGYAGATIMGDGKVALILDVAGLALMANLASLEETEKLNRAIQAEDGISGGELSDKDNASLLLFRNDEDEQFAVPLSIVERIERISVADIEHVGGKKVIQYRKGTLPLYSLDEVVGVKALPDREQLEVIIFTLGGREVGLMVTPPVDAVEMAVNIDSSTLKQPGIIGSTIINSHTTLMVDMFEFMKILNPGLITFQEDVTKKISGEATILFVEDSDFFRNQVKGFLEDDGYKVLAAEDGMVAWDILTEQADTIDMVLTDLEMPNMDGFELTKKIKEDDRFSHLPVVALTSLASDEDFAKGKEVGIDDYQIKLDRDKLLKTVKSHL